MNAQDYPVTTPYGQVAGYPLNNGFHNGVDYGCPSGTPIVVNGVTIGLSGATGYVTGPHLHVGRWISGTVTNPGSGGTKFTSAVVTEVNEDATNGKYVRVQADGASWVYLHMSNNQLVKVGQELKGEDVSTPANTELIKYCYGSWLGREANQAEIDSWQGRPLELLITSLVQSKEANQYYARVQAALAGSSATTLKPGTYKVN